MQQPIKEEFFESIAREIQGKFRRINHLTTKAPGPIGNYHESLLKSSISNFLSKRYSLKTGYMYADDENVSKQIDLMIVDENNQFTYLFQEGDFAIVRPESVVCVIEVKTNLDENRFYDAFDNIVEAKRIKYLTLSGHLTGLIFGYDSPDPTNELLGKIFTNERLLGYDKADLYPDAIQFFQQSNFLILDKASSNNEKYYYRLYKNRPSEAEKKDQAFQLSVLIRLIIGALEGNEIYASGRFKDSKAGQLIDFSNLMKGVDKFKPITGHAIDSGDPASPPT